MKSPPLMTHAKSYSFYKSAQHKRDIMPTKCMTPQCNNLLLSNVKIASFAYMCLKPTIKLARSRG